MHADQSFGGTVPLVGIRAAESGASHTTTRIGWWGEHAEAGGDATRRDIPDARDIWCHLRSKFR